ncbi:MAG TPA: VIT domain-containing protein [Polyangiaceae bacterium]|nr:VIT domain-containing protein [Polyangiaceae bacterium]
MPIYRRATSMLVCILALSCRRGSGSFSGDGIEVLDVDAPLGLDGPAISRCDRDGSGCRDLAKGDKLAPGTLVTSARGARAWLGSDAATSVDLSEDTAVFFDTARNIELRRGGIVVRRLANGQKSEPLRIDVAGRTGEIDAQVGANVVIRARGTDRAGITVEKGKLTLKADNGQTMVLLSGESAEIAKGRPPERTASFVTVEPHRRVTTNEPPVIAEAEPRGLGRMTARVPGQSDVVAGVRLVSHHIEAVIRDGLARTEVEEVFYNDTARVLEGRYVFPLPADASISRLALWVNDKPVEGEIVEKKRAAAIFKEIVDDTVRPRDPALLEWVAGGDFSLKIFPLPAKGSRKVRIAYDQVVAESGGRLRYAYPLSVGAERATTIDDFSVQVRVHDTRAAVEELETPSYATSKAGEDRGVRIAFSAKQFVPAHDFVVSYARPPQDEADLAAYVPSWGELKGAGLDGAARGADGNGYVALRLRADLPMGMTPAHVRRDRAIIIDASHSQSKETLDDEAKLAVGLVRQLDADERFVVLACDSACSTYPSSGLATPRDEQVAELEQWLGSRSPSGSSDLAGALIDAARRLEADGSAQVVYVGDGSPSSGELSADRIAARVGPLLRSRKVDLRFLGAGRVVDEIVVGALAQDLGATYEPVMTGESLERRIADLAMALRSPVIRGAAVEVPGSFVDVYPKTLRNLRLGEQVVLVGRLLTQEPGLVRLRGEVAGETYTLARPVRWTAEASRQNPLVPRLWSLAKISDLESSTDAPTVKQIVDMSKRYHVMSRYTSLLVLENDQMFAEYGIKRTAPATAGLPTEEQPTLGANQSAPRGMAPPMRERESDDRKGELAEKKADSTSEGRAGPLAPAKPKSAAPGNPYGDSSGAPSPVATMAPVPPPAAAPRSVESRTEAEDARRATRQPEPSTPSSPRDDWSSGQGGLGLSGTGEGGSGLGTGGLSIATPGNVGLDKASDSFGAGHGLGVSIGRGAAAQLGPLQVIGDLPAPAVERIARTRLGVVRVCYQSGLARDPSLAGRVNVRFVIGQEGEVVSVMNGGDDLSDRDVVTCVLGAFRGTRFPEPGASGYVTVAFPVFLRWVERPTPRPMVYVPPQPSATHRAQDDNWRNKGDEVLAKLRSDVATNPTSRRKYEDLVRALLSHGRFEEALEHAKKFVGMDPDLAVARELLAYAAVTNDDPQLAVVSVDTQTETEPTSLKWHIRGARAFEAMGDERRACAHWRALGELSPQSDEYTYESLRCRARVFDDREGALSDARRVVKPGKLLGELIPALEGGRPPPFTKSTAGAGQLEADFTCASGDRCPTVFIVSPIGNVFSPFTPTDSRSSAKSVAVAGLRDGTYTTLLAGGSPDARGEIELRAFGSTKKFSVAHGGAQTVAATKVTLPPAFNPPALRGDGFLIAR